MARGLYPEPIGDTNSQPAAGREPNDLHNLKQALRDSCKGLHKGSQALHKDFSETVGCITKAFAHPHQEADKLPAHRQVGNFARVVAMDARGWLITERAIWMCLERNCRDGKHIIIHLNIYDF